MAESEVPGGSSIAEKMGEILLVEGDGVDDACFVTDSIKLAQESKEQSSKMGTVELEDHSSSTAKWILPPVPKVEVFLKPRHRSMPVGVISAIFGTRVVVEGSEEHKRLNEGSILWITETRSPLGLIDEIIGPIKFPYYVVRYNSNKEMAGGISVGTAVSYVIESADHILKRPLRQQERAANGRYPVNEESALGKEIESPVEKYVQPPIPCAPPAMSQLAPPVTADNGRNSCTHSVGAGSASTSELEEHPAQQFNSYSNVPYQELYPPQMQEMGIEGGYPVYAISSSPAGTYYFQPHPAVQETQPAQYYSYFNDPYQQLLQQQYNPVFPPEQQQMGIQRGYPMMQVGDANYSYPHQYQIYNCFPNTMPHQQYWFVPN